MNVLIAPTERDGLILLKVFKLPREDWQVVGYGCVLGAMKPDTLVMILPRYEDIDSNLERQMISDWFDVDVFLMQARAQTVITI